MENDSWVAFDGFECTSDQIFASWRKNLWRSSKDQFACPSPALDTGSPARPYETTATYLNPDTFIYTHFLVNYHADEAEVGFRCRRVGDFNFLETALDELLRDCREDDGRKIGISTVYWETLDCLYNHVLSITSDRMGGRRSHGKQRHTHQFEKPRLLLYIHGVDIGLVAVSQITAEPSWSRCDLPVWPCPVWDIDGLERPAVCNPSRQNKMNAGAPMAAFALYKHGLQHLVYVLVLLGWVFEHGHGC